MKKIIVYLSVILLSSCAFISDSYFLAKFDPIEYKSIVDIRVLARSSEAYCDTPSVSASNAQLVVEEIDFLMLYDEPITHNLDIQKSLIELRKIAVGLKQQYNITDTVSPAFCKLKFSTIDINAGIIQKVIGNKPR